MTFFVAAGVIGGSALGAAGVAGLTLASGALVGGVVGSALAGSSSSKQAANIQADAARQGIEAQTTNNERAIAAQKEMFDRQVALQEPFRQTGITAQNQLLNYLGVRAPNNQAGFGGSSGAFGMPTIQSNASNNQAGFGKYAGDFGMSDFQQDPGYAFRVSEGLKALDAQAASRGGLISGNALRGATKYGQDAASQEYQNAFNRYQINRANQLQPLQSLAGQGQSAANTLTGAAGSLGQGIAQGYNTLGQGLAQGYGNIGNAQAAGIVGSANALNSGVGSYLGYQGQQNLISGLKPANSSSYEPTQYISMYD